MNNISQDKEKLFKLLEELEKDYQAGNISDNEYDFLSKKYGDRLSEINAIDKIRAMQGKKVVEKPVIYSSKKQMAEKSREEDEELVDKYVVKTEKEKKESKSSNKRIFAVISIVCLIIAFATGIGFGIFNFDFPPTDQTNVVVTVNETAFPDAKSNDTNKTDKKNTTDNNKSSNTKPSSNTNTNTNKDSNSNTKTDSGKTDSDTKSNSKSNPKSKPNR